MSDAGATRGPKKEASPSEALLVAAAGRDSKNRCVRGCPLGSCGGASRGPLGGCFEGCATVTLSESAGAGTNSQEEMVQLVPNLPPLSEVMLSSTVSLSGVGIVIFCCTSVAETGSEFAPLPLALTALTDTV